MPQEIVASWLCGKYLWSFNSSWR